MRRIHTGLVLVLLCCASMVGGGIVSYWHTPAAAARNSGGSMVALNGPYSPNTTINSTSVNARLADIENELTSSLDRSGRGGMLSALRGVDGTNAAPAFSYTSETGSGWYRAGASDLGLSIVGTRVGQVTANGYRTANGAVGTPSFSFLNDTADGLYRAGSHDQRYAISGVDLAQFTTSMLNVTGGVNPRSVASPFPSSGKGLEIAYLSGTDNGTIQSFDRTGAAWKPLNIDGSSVIFNSNSAGTVKIGASGNTTSQLNFGGGTFNGGTPATFTATVASGATCFATRTGVTTQDHAIKTQISGTTLTVTSALAADTTTANYLCF
jgi:hypothetical protein